MAESFAVKPVLTVAPSQPPARTTNAQKRPHAINPSPADPPYPHQPAPLPLAIAGVFPGFLSWPGHLAREDGISITKTRPKPSDCFLREHREPKETPGPRGNGSVEQAG